MDHLVLTPDRMSPDDSDFTGVFECESIRYREFHEKRGDAVTIERIDVTRSRRKVLEDVRRVIDAARFDVLVFLCHGMHDCLQLGLSSASPEALEDLARTAAIIARSSIPDLRVILYACSTGRDDAPGDTAPGSGENSFADRLRDALCGAGCNYVVVVAHTSSGHATRNPDIRFFQGNGIVAGRVGGETLAYPGTAQYAKLKHLLDHTKEFRFEFPFLTVEAIRARLK